MSRLTDYLKRNGITQERFAEKTGLTQGTISKLCAGTRGISLPTAALIERETGGEVPMSSWVVADQSAGDAA